MAIAIPNLTANVGTNTLVFAVEPVGGYITSYIVIDNVVLSNGGANVVSNGSFDASADWTLTTGATISPNTNPGQTSRWPST